MKKILLEDDFDNFDAFLEAFEEAFEEALKYKNDHYIEYFSKRDQVLDDF